MLLQTTATPSSFNYLPHIAFHASPPPTRTYTPTVTPTVTRTPTVTPTATLAHIVPMFGVWRGTTNRSDKTIQFNITGDGSQICGISSSWTGSCGFLGGFSAPITQCFPIAEGNFNALRTGTAFGSSYTHLITGNFTSTTAVSGTFRHQEGSCVIEGPWTASLTNLPTPTPRVCPVIRPGSWSGAASFTVSADRSRVLNFEIDLTFGTCATVRYSAPELPIVNCQISFSSDSGGVSFSGSGNFTSETEMSGGASVFRSSCFGSGTWTSRWVSSQ